MVIVTLASQSNFVRGVSNTLVFEVSGLADEFNVRYANDGLLRIPATGEAYAYDATIAAKEPRIDRVAPFFWRVQVDYGPRPVVVPVAGEPEEEQLPLPEGEDVPETGISVQISEIENSVQRTYDLDGTPIANSAREPVRDGLPDVRTTYSVVFRKVMKSFDLKMWKAYKNTCNADTLHLFGETLAPGMVECKSAVPDRAIEQGEESVVVVASFEVSFDDPLDKWTIRDIGNHGWYLGDDGQMKPGPFTGPDGERIEDVPLDGLGRPEDSSAGINVSGSEYPGSPGAPGEHPDVSRIGGSVYLSFKRRRLVAFAPLGLFGIFEQAELVVVK